jgi:hypothetical protein
VLAQGESVAEILISDDRSEDGTLDLVRKIGGDRVRIAINSERLGLAGNWNQCVALCRTSLIAIVHQDDRLRPGHIAAHRTGFLTSSPSAPIGLVASASGVIDREGHNVPERVVDRGGLGSADRILGPNEAFERLAEVNLLRCSAVSIRVEAHRQAGGFQPGLKYVVDWKFWLDVARNWSLHWLLKPTVDIRWHLASETHRFATGTTDLEETEQVLTENVRRLQSLGRSTSGLERSSRKRVARAYVNRAYVSLKAGNGDLAKSCLKRSVQLWPGVLGSILIDPRLAGLMTAVAVAPEKAGRWFERPHQ